MLAHTRILQKWYPAFFLDYLNNREQAQRMFPHSPDEKGFEECANRLRNANMPPDLGKLLQKQNTKCGSLQPAFDQIKKISRPGCLTVITGQQAGLMGGPLYVTYKVIRAIHLAKDLEILLDRPVVPIYWVETNDSNFNDINRVNYTDGSGELRALAFAPDRTQDLCIGRTRITDQIQSVLNDYFNTVRKTEFSESLRELLFECYRTGDRWNAAAMKLAARLYTGLGAVVFDPSDPEYVDWIQPVLKKECTDLRDASEQALEEKTGQLVQSGYKRQVDKEDRRLNVFLLDNGCRKALFYTDAGIADREGNSVDIPTARLLPNVLTRSLCQDSVFATVAFVAGPSETAYLGMLDGLYRVHGLNMPVVVPRYTGTLIDSKVSGVVGKLNADPEMFILNDRDRVVHEVFRESADINLDELNEQLETASDGFLDDISRMLPESGDQEIAKEMKMLSKTLRKGLGKVTGKIRRREKQRKDVQIARAGRIANELLPDGMLQERSLNIFQYMNLYGGVSFLKNLSETLDQSAEGHNLWKI